VPNSFCAPCAARYPPSTVRLASSAMSRIPIVSSAFPNCGRVQNSSAPLRAPRSRRSAPLTPRRAACRVSRGSASGRAAGRRRAEARR
jgi:hypothetical protein